MTDAEAILAAADTVDVPGAPLTLRLDDVLDHGRELRLAWSYVDPTGEVERTHGVTTAAAGVPATDAWAAAQLDAAHQLKRHLDLDTRPGEPHVTVRYTEDEAWQLLVDHLERWSRVEHVDNRLIIHVVDDDGVDRARCSLRTDRAAWAAYLNKFAAAETVGVDDDALWVPTAISMVDGLPLWADDDLTESLGSWVHVRVESRRIVRDGPLLD